MTTNANAVSSLIDAIKAEKSRKSAIIEAAKAACGTLHLQPAKIAEQVETFLKDYETLKRGEETFALSASKKIREDFRNACTLLLAGKFQIEVETKERGKEPVTSKLAAVDALTKADRTIEAAAKQVRDAGRTPEEIKKQEAANAKRAKAALAKKGAAERQEAANKGAGEVSKESSTANDEFALHAAWLAKQLKAKNHKALDQVLAAAGYKLVQVEIPVRTHVLAG